MKIKILIQTLNPLLALTILALLVILFRNLGVNLGINNGYIFGALLGAVIYIIVNNRKKYIYYLTTENNFHEIKYYNMFGLNRNITLSRNLEIEYSSENNFGDISYFIKFSDANKSFLFYYLDATIKETIENNQMSK